MTLDEFINNFNAKKGNLSFKEYQGLTDAQKQLVQHSYDYVSTSPDEPAQAVFKPMTKQYAEKFLNIGYAEAKDKGSYASLSPTLANAETIRQQLSEQGQQYGISWKNPQNKAEYHTANLAKKLAGQGVTSLDNLRAISSTDVMDMMTGKKISFQGKGSSSPFAEASGKGWTNYRMGVGPEGKPVFYQQWEESSDKGKVIPLASIALSVLAPGVGTAIGTALGASGVGASMIGNALIAGGTSALAGARGSDILKNAAFGAAGSYFSGAIAPKIGQAVGGGTLGRMVAGGSKGLFNSVIRGQKGNPLESFILSALGSTAAPGTMGMNAGGAGILNNLLRYAAQRKLQGKG